jgi:hypothetical protein
LLAGLEDTGSRPKRGGARTFVGRIKAAESTGGPTMAAHVNMTQAGPHGQTGWPRSPEASPPTGPCSVHTSLGATAPAARQEMTANPEIATCKAIT